MSISFIEAHLAAYYSDIQALKARTAQVSRGEKETDEAKSIKNECINYANKISSFEKEIDQKTLFKPFAKIIHSQCDSLKNKCNKLATKIDESIFICKTSKKVDELYTSYYKQEQEENSLKNFEELKNKNLELLSRPNLTFLQKKWILELDELIQCAQEKEECEIASFSALSMALLRNSETQPLISKNDRSGISENGYTTDDSNADFDDLPPLISDDDEHSELDSKSEQISCDAKTAFSFSTFSTWELKNDTILIQDHS